MFVATLVSMVLMSAPDAPLFEADLLFPPEAFHNHSSSIVETASGQLIACWFHGQGERNDDTLVIRGARKLKGETSWSAPFIMADNEHLPDQNCTLFIDPAGRLWLFWISPMDNLVRSYFLKYRYSTNYEGAGPPVWAWQDAIFCRPKDAETVFAAYLDKQIEQIKGSTEFSEERKAEVVDRLVEQRRVSGDKLFQRLGWMPRQPPIMLTDKRMMLGLYSDTFDCSMFAFTEDAGQTWEFSQPLAQRGIQPSLVWKKNGHLVAFMRDSPLVRRAESSDGGMTWTEDPIDIANSGSSVAALGLKSGNWILAVNDVPRGRHILTLFLSEDEGKTWKVKRPLENMEPEMGNAGYPTLLQTADGSLHCTYTYEDKKQFKGKTIKHVRFNEAWIRQQ